MRHWSVQAKTGVLDRRCIRCVLHVEIYRLLVLIPYSTLATKNSAASLSVSLSTLTKTGTQNFFTPIPWGILETPDPCSTSACYYFGSFLSKQPPLLYISTCRVLTSPKMSANDAGGSSSDDDDDFDFESAHVGSKRYPVHDCCENEDAESLRVS